VFSAGELSQISEVLQIDRRCSCGKSLGTCPVWSQALSISARGQMSPRMALEFLACTQELAWSVDANKTAYLSFWRPLYYKLLGYHVAIIHLVRDPKAVMGSALAGTNKQLENGLPRGRLLERQRTLLGWTFANMFATAYTWCLIRSASFEGWRRSHPWTMRPSPPSSLPDRRFPEVMRLPETGLRARDMVLRLSDCSVMKNSGLG
jgi:hypothetical protein